MAATAEAVFENLVPPPGNFLVDPPNSENDEIKAAEEKAVKCCIKFERAENDRNRLGHEFGRAMIALRAKKKAAGERDWCAYLERLGISYDLANKWINKVEGNETRHGKKAVRPKEESQPELTKKDVDSWKRIADELKVLIDHALILRNSQSVSEPSKTQLASLAKQMLKLIEGGDNA